MNPFQFFSSRLRVALMAAAILMAAVVFRAPMLHAQSDSTTSETTKSKVNINTADLNTLETLPGIGPALAQKIIDGRPYKNSADLMKVDGMSKSKISGIRKHITFGSGTTAKKKKSSTSEETAASTSSEESTSSGVRSGSKSEAPTPTGSAAGKLAPGEKININTASAADLERLPGIGPSRSQAIVDYRSENGPFKSPEDIMKVKGIKSGEFSKVKDYIKLSD